MLAVVLALLAGCGDDVAADRDAGSPARDGGADALVRDASGADAGDASEPCAPPIAFQIVPRPNESSIGVGYTGLAHDFFRLNEHTIFTLEAYDCLSCTECRVRGPIANAAGIYDNRRCLDDPAVACASDGDCTDRGGRCVYYFGGPLPTIVDVGTDIVTCTVLTLDAPDGMPAIEGTIDLRTGRVSFHRFHMHTRSTLGACATCDGPAETPADGVAGGECQAPFPAGRACDAHGASGAMYTSLDCAPDVASSLFPMRLSVGPLGTDGVSWPASRTIPCPADPAQRCWCSVCTDDPTIGCNRNADCPTGTCRGTADLGLPDACMMDCVAQPGSPYGRCAGAATSCFATSSELEVTGEIEILGGGLRATLGAIYCVPGTPGGMLTESALGLPGPGVARVEFEITPIYR
jgi:hypothetical protein